MFNILSKDALRQQVENASDGRVTILYDDDGYPNHMVIIPKMNIGDIYGAHNTLSSVLDGIDLDTPHPAFQFEHKEGEEIEIITVPELFIAQYPMSVHERRMRHKTVYTTSSLPGVKLNRKLHTRMKSDPNESLMDTLSSNIKSKGKNWKMMGIWEHGLIQGIERELENPIYPSSIVGTTYSDKSLIERYVGVRGGRSDTIILRRIISPEDLGAGGKTLFNEIGEPQSPIPPIGSIISINELRDGNVFINKSSGEIVDIGISFTGECTPNKVSQNPHILNQIDGYIDFVVKIDHGLRYLKSENIRNLYMTTPDRFAYIDQIIIENLPGGSGLRSSHDGTFSGVFDLVSYPGELVDGFRVQMEQSGDKRRFFIKMDSTNCKTFDINNSELYPYRYEIQTEDLDEFTLKYFDVEDRFATSPTGVSMLPFTNFINDHDFYISAAHTSAFDSSSTDADPKLINLYLTGIYGEPDVEGLMDYMHKFMIDKNTYNTNLSEMYLVKNGFFEGKSVSDYVDGYPDIMNHYLYDEPNLRNNTYITDALLKKFGYEYGQGVNFRAVYVPL